MYILYTFICKKKKKTIMSTYIYIDFLFIFFDIIKKKKKSETFRKVSKVRSIVILSNPDLQTVEPN